MDYLHCNPREVVRIYEDLKSRRSVAVHWGTFVLADNQYDELPRLLREEVEQRRRKGGITKGMKEPSNGERIISSLFAMGILSSPGAWRAGGRMERGTLKFLTKRGAGPQNRKI
mmetsp:Transcript_25354/g.74612  ORF Transcript_25354/g.74612 Transcript_25354/m.74612 type:complete len:114 (-) Transcript_25354:8-349(-)